MTNAEKAADARPKLIIRNAETADIPGIRALNEKVYASLGEHASYTEAQIRAHLHHFLQGQFVALYKGAIVGHCATFRIDDAALRPHDWATITGRGYASRHDPDGDWLYGMDVNVDPDFRGLRIGQRLYGERRKLCEHLRLKGIVFGGRLPGLGRRWKQVGSAERYIDLVRDGKIRDLVMSFQLRNGFEAIGVLPGYLPFDHESRGFGAHMIWRNPRVSQEAAGTRPRNARKARSARVAAIQYQLRQIGSFEEFASQVEYFVDAVADYKADFAVFPELFTLQLLSIERKRTKAAEAIAALDTYTERFKTLMSRLAVAYNVNVLGGSTPTRDPDGTVFNTAYMFLRDGSVHQQRKIHPTPNERYWWGIRGGDEAAVIDTDCGRVGIMVCYDSEFPELARHLVDQGAQILFVPFCTDERQSYLRVRYCCQSRAVENQCYVVMAGNVGNLPNVDNMDIQYAQSCILTPCDFPFARDGIAADTTPNAEMIAVADLQLDNLAEARQHGTVQNLRDRRFDLYSVAWRDRGRTTG